ncbi:hypothetical protein HNR39_000178 [Glaciimonas immobilis]|uniref:Uncharacterized protein n=1 Tax=Glaciimonas immobilis TaxID=728004 RepID=A0A840RN44_9BURK|nr:hypothetical protein [Glaciimonas immobilis]
MVGEKAPGGYFNPAVIFPLKSQQRIEPLLAFFLQSFATISTLSPHLQFGTVKALLW